MTVGLTRLAHRVASTPDRHNEPLPSPRNTLGTSLERLRSKTTVEARVHTVMNTIQLYQLYQLSQKSEVLDTTIVVGPGLATGKGPHRGVAFGMDDSSGLFP